MTDKMIEMAEREAIDRARLMWSGRYRIPWSYAGAVARSLQDKGLLDIGGYLTDAGLALRTTTKGSSE